MGNTFIRSFSFFTHLSVQTAQDFKINFFAIFLIEATVIFKSNMYIDSYVDHEFKPKTFSMVNESFKHITSQKYIRFSIESTQKIIFKGIKFKDCHLMNQSQDQLYLFDVSAS
jgi:hypothetical protein